MGKYVIFHIALISDYEISPKHHLSWVSKVWVYIFIIIFLWKENLKNPDWIPDRGTKPYLEVLEC